MRFVAACILLVPAAAAHAAPLARAATAPAAPAAAGSRTAAVLVLSDIHLEPYHDPAKVALLAAAPVSRWPAILAAPDSPTQAAAYSQLREQCATHGIDTSPALLADTLAAARSAVHHPTFIAVPGDLLGHRLDCRFHALMPHAGAHEAERFAADTAAYVVLMIRRAFPGVPVYVALGNNDSGCGDYAETPGSTFLHETAEVAGDAAFAGRRTSAGRHALTVVAAEQGDWSVRLPAPFVRGRLIVMQDLFESEKYHTCNNGPSAAPAAAQLRWLHTQLQAAEAAHESVWVMGHVPPGVDVFSTVTRGQNICGGVAPARFLADDKLTELLTAYAGTVRLALFAHTHNDELHVLHVAGKPLTAPDADDVAMKLTPSVSPINGNLPSFTVAEVDTATVTMRDYAVWSAATLGGGGWHQEYRFSSTYHLASYTPAALVPMLGGLRKDAAGKTEAGDAALRFLFPGDKAALLRLIWPSYTCSFTESDSADYRRCVCGAAAPAPPALPPAPPRP